LPPLSSATTSDLTSARSSGVAERGRTNHPILGDAMAEEIVHTLDYDYGQFKLSKNLIISAALQAKKAR
jgi:hypothetical protein